MESYDIKDGIRLRLIKSKKFKTISMAVLIRRALNKDEVTLNSVLVAVMRQGCSRYRNMRALNIALENMYGAIFQGDIMKKGEEQLLEFYIEVLNKEGLLKEAFDFLNDVICYPLIDNDGFNEDYVDIAKNNVKNIIEDRINDKREYAKERCIELMCQDEPYGICADGYIEELAKIDGKRLYKHYCSIIESSQIEILVVGDVEAEEVLKLTGELDFKRGKLEAMPSCGYHVDVIGENCVEEEMDISQAKLCIGLRANIEPRGMDYYKALIANEVLGGSANSRLFSALRESNGLCYYVNSTLYRFKSILIIQAGIDSESYKKAVEMINQAIKDIKAKGISKKELESARLSVVNRYKALMDYPSNLMDYYLGQAIVGDEDNIEAVIKKVSDIEDIGNALEGLTMDTVYFLRGEKCE